MAGETTKGATRRAEGVIPPLTPGILEALAADGLPTVGERHFGVTGIALADFPSDDAGLVEALYTFLGEIYERARAVYQGSLDAAALVAFLKARSFSGVLAPRFAGLGAGLDRDSLGLAVRQAYHDIRGGSYNALALLLEVVEADEALPGELERVYLLVRDHMKIMRSAVHDLDPEATAADQEILHHRVELLREKWAGVEYTIAGSRAAIDYRSSFAGSVADCCIEFAALDRVLYNLINNATRFTTDGAVYVRVEPLAEAAAAGPGNVRFAVINRISAGQRARLRGRFGGDDLRELFVGGFTTGGHGVGLRICADLVVHGYRLPSLREALTCGLVGARILGDCFVAWFHWPGRTRDAAGAAV